MLGEGFITVVNDLMLFNEERVVVDCFHCGNYGHNAINLSDLKSRVGCDLDLVFVSSDVEEVQYLKRNGLI